MIKISDKDRSTFGIDLLDKIIDRANDKLEGTLKPLVMEYMNMVHNNNHLAKRLSTYPAFFEMMKKSIRLFGHDEESIRVFSSVISALDSINGNLLSGKNINETVFRFSNPLLPDANKYDRRTDKQNKIESFGLGQSENTKFEGDYSLAWKNKCSPDTLNAYEEKRDDRTKFKWGFECSYGDETETDIVEGLPIGVEMKLSQECKNKTQAKDTLFLDYNIKNVLPKNVQMIDETPFRVTFSPMDILSSSKKIADVIDLFKY